MAVRQNSEELSAALTALRGTTWSLVMMSGVLNVIYLTGSFFMLEIYDRVIPSKSLPTLIGLCIIVAVLYMGQGVLDLIRNCICNRLGDSLDAKLGRRVYDAIIRLPLKLRSNGDSLQPIRDLDQVRSFLSSGGPLAFLDLPFMPLYLAICFLFHVWIGVACLIGMAVLISLAYLAEVKTKAPTKAAFALATPGTHWLSLDAVMPRYSRLWAWHPS
jgi:ATP-binding cassette, subfamily C, bacterial PrsD